MEKALETANFKALYYSTLVRVAKHELGVDVEKKSVTAPAARQAIRFMLTNHPNISIRQLEGVLGFSRQGYYQYWQRQADQVNHDADILQLVKKVRQDHPRIGGRKLYWLLQDAFLKRAGPPVRNNDGSGWSF